MPYWTGTTWQETRTGVTYLSFRPPSGFGTEYDTWTVRYRDAAAAGSGWVTRTLRARESFENPRPRSLTSGPYDWQVRFYNRITGVNSGWMSLDTAFQTPTGRGFYVVPFAERSITSTHTNSLGEHCVKTKV